jgi:hypothetical protein
MGLLDRLFGPKDPELEKVQHGGGDMVSLVILSQSSPDLTLESVRSTLDAVFPGQFLPPREEGNFVIDGGVPGAVYMIHCSVPGANGMFMFHNVPGPYAEFSDISTRLSGALRDLALKQPCWMSIDLMHAYDADDDGYRFIGPVLAQLAPTDAAVLLHPSKMTAVEFTPDVRRQLASGGQPFGEA